jgi:hypothetical protein
MLRVLRALQLIPVCLAATLACHAGEIRLDNGTILTVTEIEAHRFLPHAFYDQAVASLARLYPDHVMLAQERTGRIGEVNYALVCYRIDRLSEHAVIQALAVREKRAWRLEADTPLPHGDGLEQVLEQIGRLPAGSGN